MTKKVCRVRNMVAASQRGRAHAHEGKPRDDHFMLHHSDTSGWYIMAVADGAGSATYSREGSRLACQAAVEHCEQELEGNTEFETAVKAFYEDQTQLRTTRNWVYRILGNAALKAHTILY